VDRDREAEFGELAEPVLEAAGLAAILGPSPGATLEALDL
jgi:hypothetical protein